MPATSTTLVSTTTYGNPIGNYDGSSTTFSSDTAKADGYYGYTDGLHTVAYFPNTSFVGTIKMQGSLALTPTSADWFDIDGTTLVADADQTGGSTFNFTGNFVWVRATITLFTAGSITKIQLNY